MKSNQLVFAFTRSSHCAIYNLQMWSGDFDCILIIMHSVCIKP